MGAQIPCYLGANEMRWLLKTALPGGLFRRSDALIFYEISLFRSKTGIFDAETGFAGLHPPPPSRPKLAVEDLPAERPIFGGFFAIVRAALASLRIGLVS
jgi:hypothetical protein